MLDEASFLNNSYSHYASYLTLHFVRKHFLRSLLKYPHETGLILRCTGKGGNPFKTKQGNQPSCHDQEGKRLPICSHVLLHACHPAEPMLPDPASQSAPHCHPHLAAGNVLSRALLGFEEFSPLCLLRKTV